MDKPLTFFIIVGVVVTLFLHYSGSSFFSEGPLATGPGGGLGEPPPPLSFNGAASSVTGKQPPAEGFSPYKDEVFISGINISANLENEQLIIKRGGFAGSSEKKPSINLDGWSLERRNGGSIQIPKALRIPSDSIRETPIELGEGEEIIVTSGATSFGSSFRENICTGYFNEFYSFSPSLPETCPNFSRGELFKAGLNSTCVDLIERAARCRQIRIGFEEQAAGNECVDFTKKHLNYAGCLRDNREKPNFLFGRWRVFLNKKESPWDPKHDQITLKDKNGLIVNEYSY